MLALETQKTLEKLLIDRKLVTKNQLEDLKAESAKTNKSIFALIAENRLVSEEDLTKITAQATRTPYADLSNIIVADSILNLLPKDLAKNYMSVPFGEMNGKLAVGMVDPSNVQAIDFISRKVNRPIMPFMVSESSVNNILKQYKTDVTEEVSAAIINVNELNQITTDKEAKPDKAHSPSVKDLVQDAPITRALNMILDSAAQLRASDVHIEPREKEVVIRFRVDGILQKSMTLPKTIEPALISRVKILSNLKIDEHRIPQDGQFQFVAGGHDIDVRVAIAPTVYGEQVVIRLLDKDESILTLDALGLHGRAFRLVKEGIIKPHGMTLATGPTGSGKSTTLYAIVAQINSSEINIVTLEDPVEYRINGINQIQVNADVGLTFASGLRSILRQDPNVVMVGEIRDNETAELAVQAALTGHVVLSTLHTNSAAGVLPRLLDMKIEPFLILSTVNTVIGQRLVRKICEKCREKFQTSPAQTEAIKKAMDKLLPKTESEVRSLKKDLGYEDLPLAGQSAYTLYKGKGCSECTNGYKGRIGIYEVFTMSAPMEKLLVNRATSKEIQDQAQADGMITMQQDGYLKALNGITTLEEVARVAADY